MYRCCNCDAVFQEPVSRRESYESYYGVGSMFQSRNYFDLEECPNCGSDDIETVRYCDIYDCEDCPRYGDDCDGEDRFAYYEREGDEYVYYDENECELYREPV